MKEAKTITLEDQTARIKHKCSNPFCESFYEIPNKFDVCIDCFRKLVDICGGIHHIYNYDDIPPSSYLSQKKAIKCLVLNEHNKRMERLFHVSNSKKTRSLTVKKREKRCQIK